jgi:hypothetical protein
MNKDQTEGIKAHAKGWVNMGVDRLTGDDDRTATGDESAVDRDNPSDISGRLR